MPYQIIWSWYAGRWWVGCYVWYSDEGTGRGPSPPRPLIAVPNVTAHPPTASVPITVLLYNDPLLCGFNVPIKGLNSVKTAPKVQSFQYSARTSTDRQTNGRSAHESFLLWHVTISLKNVVIVGVTLVTWAVDLLRDNEEDEPTEKFKILLRTPTNALLGEVNRAVVHVLNVANGLYTFSPLS